MRTMQLEYRFKEWICSIRDEIYKDAISAHQQICLEELTTYQTLLQHFKFLLEEGDNLISVVALDDKLKMLDSFHEKSHPKWNNVANWTGLDQEDKHKIILDYFTSGCHAYRALNILPDDIKNYILAHSL